MSTPNDRQYSESHEWFLKDGETVTIGITRHAADELTDITYVEMMPQGTSVDAGTSVGEVESVKTTADVVSMVGGSVVEVNENVATDPSLVNSDPYGEGWLVKLNVSDASSLEGLMDGETYEQLHGSG
ncbi:MAG: glycine cleavage system protein GcvH [Phycisphaerales bacterium]|nr:glycine cleavage system protein GcvH [Phycisphaerales bacterium]